MAFELPHEYEEYFKEWEEKIGAFTDFWGFSENHHLPFAIKDNIALEGFSMTCGSKLLKGFKAPYTATAAEKLINAGYVPIGKTNLDEFGMGSTTDNSAIKQTNNPWDINCVAGGSSGGSAAAVAAGLVPFALGSDTGGSVRQPAAFCGVAGLKSTYGAVSRHGLTAYASSLEVIGILADTISRCRKVFSVIRGSDTMDQTSRDAPQAASALYGEGRRKVRVIGVLSPIDGLDDEVRDGFETAKANFAALGYKLKDVEIPSLKYAAPAYYTIAAAEASANLARFDGIRYGKSRNNFGDEVKLRILLGTFVLRHGFQERYYLRAQKIRAGIKRSFEALLGDSDYSGAAGECDAILMPVFPTVAFDRGAVSLSPFAQKAADIFTCCANLAGLPALSFPASLEDGKPKRPQLPVGVQLIGRAFAEGTLLDIAEDYENAYPFPHPNGYKNFWGKD